MKTKIIHLAATLFAVVTLAPAAFAGPGIGYWKNQGRESQFRSPKSGSSVSYTCNQCGKVSGNTVTTHAQAMAPCKQGASVVCSSCTKTTKLVMKRERNAPASHTEVIYVNGKGQECNFLAVNR